MEANESQKDPLPRKDDLSSDAEQAIDAALKLLNTSEAFRSAVPLGYLDTVEMVESEAVGNSTKSGILGRQETLLGEFRGYRCSTKEGRTVWTDTNGESIPVYPRVAFSVGNTSFAFSYFAYRDPETSLVKRSLRLEVSDHKPSSDADLDGTIRKQFKPSTSILLRSTVRPNSAGELREGSYIDGVVSIWTKNKTLPFERHRTAETVSGLTSSLLAA